MACAPTESESSKISPEEGGDMVNDLFLLFNDLKKLDYTKTEIENKIGIKLQEHKCWSEDDIKQAWKETKTMDIKTARKWAFVAVLEVLRRFDCNICKQNAAQKNHDATTEKPGYEAIPEDSGFASRSQLSASSTGEAPSPAEINQIANSSNSGTSNAAFLNEDEDTLVNNYDQGIVDDYELYVANTLDPEDETWEDDDINQACGKAESIKGNSEDRSSHGNDELKTETAAEGVRHLTGRKRSVSYGQTHIGTQGGTGTQILAEIQDTANDSGPVNSQSGAHISAAPSNDEKNMDICDECNYIYIPLSVLSSKSPPESLYENTNADPNADTNSDYNYKLIDQYPSETQHCKLYGKKSYVMLYDTDKKNAQWVYEILNKSTVPYHYMKVTFKKDNDIDDEKQALDSIKGFENTDYERGHLASAANHMWCQEAYKDTYLISNMTPQIKSMNKGIWKTLENYCRNIIYKDDEVRNVHVYTGPIYKNFEGLTIKGKAVPTHYFKVVIFENVNGKAKVECYVVENKERVTERIYLRDCISNINIIEEMSGLTFTHKSDNNKVTVKKTLRCTGENERKQATIEVHVST